MKANNIFNTFVPLCYVDIYLYVNEYFLDSTKLSVEYEK